MQMQQIMQLPRNIHGPLRSSIVIFDLPRVVEELVNNSLDAGSAKVCVFVNVRACYVKIQDDGFGITRDELVILGEKHATSKACSLDDTDTSPHFGFKGETLFSLSDISIVEVRTRAQGKPNAYCKIIKGSRCLFLGIDDQREGVGTTVTVRDLFYNQPVRRRYMQSSSKKVLLCVKKVVLRAALVHPQVSFRLIDTDSEDELLYTIPSSSPIPLVSSMFGDKVSGSLHKITFSSDMLKLSGYISGLHDACSTKVLQYLFVNSRFVSKGLIHNLLNSLASNVLCSSVLHVIDPPAQTGKKQKIQANPAFILNLCCPFSLYDLHFEPSKTIIQFKDWDAVLCFFEQAFRHFWQQYLTPSSPGSYVPQNNDAPKRSIMQNEELACLSDHSPLIDASQPCQKSILYKDSRKLCKERPNTFHERHSSREDAIFGVPECCSSLELAKWHPTIQKSTDGDISHVAVDQTDNILNISSGILHYSSDSLVPESINKGYLHDARVLFQVDKKFIPVMASGILMIIDQHAADERIRLEQLRQQVVSGEGKRIVYLDSEKQLVLPEMGFQLLQKYAEKIQKWGWIYNPQNASPELFTKNMNLLKRNAPCVTLVAVPCILGISLTDIDLLEYIDQLVETDGSSSIPPSVLRILSLKACRGAIMFGDSLLPSECSLIVEELKATSLCFQCAHGRPTTVPLLNIAALHEELAKLKIHRGNRSSSSSKDAWHGLCHRRPSIQHARWLLDSAKRCQIS